MPTDEEIYTESRRLAEAGQPADAYLKVLELVSKGTALWQPYFEAGQFSLARGKQDMAMGLLRAAVSREGQEMAATESLAGLLAEEGRWEEGLALWRRKLSQCCSREVVQGLGRFISAWDGADEPLENLFLDFLRGPYDRLQEFAEIERLSHLHRGVKALPPQSLPGGSPRYEGMVSPLHSEDQFPEVRRWGLRDVVVRPHSEVPLWDGKALLPDFLDLEQHLLRDSLFGRTQPLPGGERVSIAQDAVRKRLKSGILLSSWGIQNWAHFLTELAPLAALVEEARIPESVPLVISQPPSAQFLECLERVKSPRRPIEILEGATQVEEAILFSPVATAPFEYLNARCGRPVKYGPGDNLFSPGALAALRSRVLRGVAPSAPGLKLYLDRDSSRRRITNRGEVLRAFRDAGFEVVAPERLSFPDQLALFARAKVIAGQSGAGLANMIFAPAGAQVLVLSGNPTDPGPHCYFPNLARALGHRMVYQAFGPPSPGLHLDFEVDLAVLDGHLKTF